LRTSLTTPPPWPLPVRHTDPASERRREREEAALRALYPDAAPWYGVHSGRWLAAPSGASGLFQAPTAAALSEMLADHYRRMIPHAPRPAGTEQPCRPGGAFGAVARRTAVQPPMPRATAPSTPPATPPRLHGSTEPAVLRLTAPREPAPSRPTARPEATRRPTPARSASSASRPPGRRDARRPAPQGGWFRRGLARLGLVAVTS